ncbi:MAG: hypothetical protein EZS28_009070 [Streblomastix strix]|uniref:Cilia-and flagella-associated protein 96 n=1 Tax=Streblomastix strix TaxID=222440 RepID=A0A5J4WK23_9EUKA|nr:MAG: hypothetical protein EZS28_009070 [Streblomastix strix]
MTSKQLVGATALHDLHIFDQFEQPKFHSIGDPYNDKRVYTDRDKGKQLLTNPIKKGHNDHMVLLEKNYTPLFANDGYTEMTILERRQEVENLKKNIVPKPFIPSNPPKKGVGKGSLYGTIMPPPEHQSEGFKYTTREDIKHSPRQFQTNPAKQGSYGGGYHTTILGKEFEYTTEPYGGDKTKKWAGQDTQGKQITSKAFLYRQYGDREFDPKIFGEEGILLRSKSVPKPAKPITVPFKGMSTIQPTINKFPEYKEDQGRERKPEKPHGIWKPSGTDSLSIPQGSIALKGISERQTLARSVRF